MDTFVYGFVLPYIYFHFKISLNSPISNKEKCHNNSELEPFTIKDIIGTMAELEWPKD